MPEPVWAPGFEPPKEPNPVWEWVFCFWVVCLQGVMALLEIGGAIAFHSWGDLLVGLFIVLLMSLTLKWGKQTRAARVHVRQLQRDIAVDMAHLYAIVQHLDSVDDDDDVPLALDHVVDAEIIDDDHE